MHPGKQSVGYNCPQPDGTVIIDNMPTIQFTFKAGHSYELHCKNGSPVISERTQGA